MRRIFLTSVCHHWQVEGLVETSPGVRSVMVEYDPAVLPLGALLALLQKTDEVLPEAVTQLPSRVVKLPIAFGDRWTKAAIQRSACTPPGPLLAIKDTTCPYLPILCDQEDGPFVSTDSIFISVREFIKKFAACLA